MKKIRSSCCNHLDSAIRVTSSIDQAAKQIRRNSYCVFQTSPLVTDQISRSRTQALKILDQPTSVLESLYQNCHQIVNGNLHGFHLPSPAKRLFRAFPWSESQPWPNDAFRESSKDLAVSLHEILVAIVEKLKEMSESNDMNGDQQNGNSHQSKPSDPDEMNVSSRKRKRNSNEPMSAKDTTSPSKKNAAEMLQSTTTFETTKCPLDYFFYHNGEPRQVNCSEHIDRGALIAVCLSSASAGLEVLQRGHSEFVCPEASLIHQTSLYEERQPVSGLICIMAGDQLGGLIGCQERMACVHRVRNNLTRARLSISYELRL